MITGPVFHGHDKRFGLSVFFVSYPVKWNICPWNSVIIGLIILSQVWKAQLELELLYQQHFDSFAVFCPRSFLLKSSRTASFNFVFIPSWMVITDPLLNVLSRAWIQTTGLLWSTVINVLVIHLEEGRHAPIFERHMLWLRWQWRPPGGTGLPGCESDKVSEILSLCTAEMIKLDNFNRSPEICIVSICISNLIKMGFFLKCKEDMYRSLETF